MFMLYIYNLSIVFTLLSIINNDLIINNKSSILFLFSSLFHFLFNINFLIRNNSCMPIFFLVRYFTISHNNIYSSNFLGNLFNSYSSLLWFLYYIYCFILFTILFFHFHNTYSIYIFNANYNYYNNKMCLSLGSSFYYNFSFDIFIYSIGSM